MFTQLLGTCLLPLPHGWALGTHKHLRPVPKDPLLRTNQIDWVMGDLMGPLASQGQNACVWVRRGQGPGQTCTICGHSEWENAGCLPVAQNTREIVPEQRQGSWRAYAHGDEDF